MRIPKKIKDIDQEIFSHILHDEIGYCCMNDYCEFYDYIDMIHYKLIDFEFYDNECEDNEELYINFNCVCLECGWEQIYNKSFYIGNINDKGARGIRKLFELLSANALFKIKVINR
ncbi:hypothetical protein M0R36_09725 [bacterium]|jgi:hypothetical protein|nr:hypothetical protein [bacterium]